MRTLLPLILVVTIMGVGCGPEEKSASKPSATPASAMPVMGAPVNPAPSGATPPPPSGGALAASPKPGLPDVKFDVDQANECLREFVRENKRLPTNVQELVSSGYLARGLPVPAGKTLVVDTAKKRLVLAPGNWQAELPPLETDTANSGSATGRRSPPPPPGMAAVPEAQRRVPFSLASINEVLRDFTRENDRLPTNVHEMVTSGYLVREPELPAGKRVVLDPRQKKFILADDLGGLVGK